MKQNNYLTLLEKQEIIRLFTIEKLNPTAIGRIVGRGNWTISQFLKRNGYKTPNSSKSHRTYKINEDFFDVIDTEEKAYVLGFLYADGCNYEPKNTILINLKYTDKEILEKISSLLYVEYKELKYKIPKNTGHNTQPQYMFSICSQKMSKRLAEIGCTNNKSLTLEFPTEVPDYLVNHFIRGYVDGDGWIGEKSLGVASTHMFLIKIQEILENILSVKSCIRISKPNSTNQITSMLECSGALKVDKVYDWLYEEATIYLQRKYNTYIERKARRSIPKPIKLCKIINCGRKSRARDYCRSHYYKNCLKDKKLKNGLHEE